jgi:hypothetical protein
LISGLRLLDRRALVIVLVTLAAFASGYGLWRMVDRLTEEPSLVCSLPDAQRCQDTLASISDSPDLALSPRPDGALVAIDVRAAPTEWKSSIDPGFREAEWAIWIELDAGSPILAACYYSSDSLVSCHTEERE